MKRRWIYHNDGRVTEVSRDWKPTKRTDAVDRYVEDARLYGSGNGVAPGTKVLINTKRRHKAFMKERGWTTADDFKESWAKAEERRATDKSYGTDETATSGYPKEFDADLHRAVEKAFHDVVDRGIKPKGGLAPLPEGLRCVEPTFKRR